LVYVIWTNEALSDLCAIKDYISRTSPATAERFCWDLFEAPNRLQTFPMSGAVVPEFAIESLREILFGDYRILYQVAQGACYVRTVVHGSRDLQRHIDPSNWDLS
jgi:plasmid stabilization system protein ParE